jgi:hypothetical protein
VKIKRANKITGAKAGGPRRFGMRTRWVARFAQFCRSASLPRMRHRIQLFGLLACFLLAGCAYNRQFFGECRPAVPTMRDYAIQHLPDLSQDEKEFISATEPRLAQANYIEVHFTWTNVCEVFASSPPCEPFQVRDLRKRP